MFLLPVCEWAGGVLRGEESRIQVRLFIYFFSSHVVRSAGPGRGGVEGWGGYK